MSVIPDVGTVDVLVVRTGELRPEITEPTVIGAVVRVPAGYGLVGAIGLARAAIAPGDSTECVRVVVDDIDSFGDDDPVVCDILGDDQ